MTGNRFEQVDEPPGDAMTLVLTRDDDRNFGVVNCPASASGGQLPKNFSSGELPPKEAFRAAIRLANDLKVPLLVVDPDGLWQTEWGALYREVADE